MRSVGNALTLLGSGLLFVFALLAGAAYQQHRGDPNPLGGVWSDSGTMVCLIGGVALIVIGIILFQLGKQKHRGDLAEAKVRKLSDGGHHRVRHPRELLAIHKENWLERQSWLVGKNDHVLDWLADHVLASMLMFDIALIVPLLVIPMQDSVKITLGVISGSWIQWWALPALQRSQVKADRKREAKADADHEALTHIAQTVDAILAKVETAKP